MILQDSFAYWCSVNLALRIAISSEGYNEYVGRFLEVNASVYRDTYSSTAPKPTVHPVTDPLDEVMIDPVTKLKITRRQWEAMSTTSKSVEVSKPSDANFNYQPEEKQTMPESVESVALPTLPKESKKSTKLKYSRYYKPVFIFKNIKIR
jgi:hypothetical protein